MAAENNKGGYDVEFVNNEPNDVTCSICLFVLREPMQAEQCGHRFCKSCIDDLRNSQGVVLICPEDRNEINVYNDRGKEREILNSLIKCPNYKKDCGWTSELRELNKHLSVCGYQIVVCNNRECQENIPRNDMKSHLQQQCVYRIIECVYCCGKYQFLQHDDHISQCERYPIYCGNNCGRTNIPRSYMETHLLNQCPKVAHRCKYADIGCEELVTLDRIDSHLKEAVDSHLLCAVNTVKDQSQQIESQAHQIHIQSTKLVEQSKQIGAQSKQINDQTAMNEQQQQQINMLGTQIAALNNQLASVLQKLEVFDERHYQIKAQGMQIDLLNCKLENPEASITNVTKRSLVWKMENFDKKFQGAQRGHNTHTKRFYALDGYKCKIAIYLSGEGDFQNEFISIYVGLEEGPFDDTLNWPMNAKITFCAVDIQGNDVFHKSFDTLYSKESKKYFQRPRNEFISFGIGDFIPHGQLYCCYKDDSVTFKIKVDAV